MWKEIGFEPVVIYVGKPDAWTGGCQTVAGETCEDLFILSSLIEPIEGYDDGTIAQAARLIGSSLPVHDDDYILTTDVDLLPIQRAYFEQADMSKPIHLFFSNAYGQHNGPHYPICHIGANRIVWNQLVGCEGRPTPWALISKIMADLPPNSPHPAAWNFDEEWISRKISSSPLFGQAQHISRGFNPYGFARGRIDRGQLHELNPPIGEAIDCHAWRPGYSLENWPKIREIFKHVVPEGLEWADIYHRKFASKIENL